MEKKVLRLLSWGVLLLGAAGFVLAAPLPPGFARWLVSGTLAGLAGMMGFAALLHSAQPPEPPQEQHPLEGNVGVNQGDPGDTSTDLKAMK